MKYNLKNCPFPLWQPVVEWFEGFEKELINKQWHVKEKETFELISEILGE